MLVKIGRQILWMAELLGNFDGFTVIRFLSMMPSYKEFDEICPVDAFCDRFSIDAVDGIYEVPTGRKMHFRKRKPPQGNHTDDLII